MMNYQFQFQNLKQQLGNIDIQLGQLMNQNYMTSSTVYNMTIQILNIGISMLNIGTQTPNMGNDVFNYALQIENIGMQIQNFGNQLKNMNNMNNNMIIPNNNMMMQFNMNNDEEWMKGFKMGVEEIDKEEEEFDGSPHMNIIFKTIQGVFHNVIYKYGTTIDEVLKKFLYRVGRDDLINQGKVCFLYHAIRLKFGDKTKVEDFFLKVITIQ